MNKKIIYILYSILLTTSLYSQIPDVPDIPRELELIEKYYYFAISSLEYSKEVGFWKIEIGRTENPDTLYWNKGCLLPLELIHYADEYEPFFSYFYPTYIPNPEHLTKETKERILNNTNIKKDKIKPKSIDYFFNAVYNGHNYKTIVNHLISIYFLGQVVSVQRHIFPILKQIQKEIFALGKTNPDVAYFLENIDTLGGYNPRTIAGNKNRSLHSWGIAVDILPKNNKKHIYWDWSRRSYGNNWINIPIGKRWCPPEEVINIFEKYGFLWGGKWDIWDNMHFEYRPEVIALRNEMFFDKSLTLKY